MIMQTDQKKILIIDDEVDIREMLRYALEKQGYHVHAASNGQEGLDSYQQNGADLILLDVHMPVMDGMQFYEKWHAVYQDTHIPIVALTGDLRIHNLFEGFNVDAYVAKPFTLDELLKIMRLVLRKG